MSNLRSSLLWSSCLLGLLFCLQLPILNSLALLFLIVPLIVMFVKQPFLQFIVYTAVVFSIVAIATHYSIYYVALFYLLPAIVIGYGYKKAWPAAQIVVTGTMAFLATIFTCFIILDVVYGQSITSEIKRTLQEIYANLQQASPNNEFLDQDKFAQFVQTTINVIPFSVIMMSFLATVFVHGVTAPLLRKSGHTVLKLGPAQSWMLPKRFIFYYLIVVIIDFFVADEGSSFITVALLNLVPMMQFAFSVQAISLAYYLAEQYKWHRIIPLLLAVTIIIFPLLNIVGMLDTGFRIRYFFKLKQS